MQSSQDHRIKSEDDGPYDASSSRGVLSQTQSSSSSLQPHHRHHQQQQQQQQHQVAVNPVSVVPPSSASHVNGRGLWRSWRRNFRRPLDAMLDLVDNAVDAADAAEQSEDDYNDVYGGRGQGSGSSSGGGRIQIDRYTGASGDTNEDDAEGIKLMNTAKHLKPMDRILEVFSSEKQNDAIGENGVGVKQASANLSDFSLLVTRVVTQFHRTVQVGILSAALQQDSGVCLPSYTFSLAARSLEDDIQQLIDADANFALCLKHFGGMPMEDKHKGHQNLNYNSAGDYLQTGKDRLESLITEINQFGDRHGSSHVFCLVLAALRVSESAKELLDELRETMPRTYIHALQPQDGGNSTGQQDHHHTTSVYIDRQRLRGQYWERRLAEIACCYVYVDPREPASSSSSYSNARERENELYNIYDNNNMRMDRSNSIRIFLGFDPLRAADGDRQSCASMYIYSRRKGRLIRYAEDARTELQLTSGGTDFCQGLTIILDDYNGKLPLTPTKQDVSWADKGEQGERFRQSVYAWLRGVTYVYYDHYRRTYGSKGTLTIEVKKHVDLARRLQKWDSPSLEGMLDQEPRPAGNRIYSLEESDCFSKMVGFGWSSRKGRIHATRKDDVRLEYRAGTLIRFGAPPPPPQPKPWPPRQPPHPSHPPQQGQQPLPVPSAPRSEQMQRLPPAPPQVQAQAQQPIPAQVPSAKRNEQPTITIEDEDELGGAARPINLDSDDDKEVPSSSSLKRKRDGDGDGSPEQQHVASESGIDLTGPRTNPSQVGVPTARLPDGSSQMREQYGQPRPQTIPSSHVGCGPADAARVDGRVQELENRLSAARSDLEAARNLLGAKSRDIETIHHERIQVEEMWANRLRQAQHENQQLRGQLALVAEEKKDHDHHHRTHHGNSEIIMDLRRQVDMLTRENSALLAERAQFNGGVQQVYGQAMNGGPGPYTSATQYYR